MDPWQSSKHPEEAATLIDFLINDKDAAKILMTVRGVPAPDSVRETIAPLREEMPSLWWMALTS